MTNAKVIEGKATLPGVGSVTMTKDNAETIAGLTIHKAGSRRYQGVFMTLYAQGGGGKTTLAAELYKIGRTLYIDAEGGTDSIAHLQDEPNLDIVDVSDYKQFKRLGEKLKLDTEDYVNIVVDNLSEIIDLCEIDVGIVGNDAHDLQRYKLMTREIMRQVRLYRELSRIRGLNVIICAWDSDEKDDRGVLKKDLAFTPKLREEYPGICTIIGHVDVTNNPDLRRLNFAPGPKTVSKFKRSQDSAAMKIPYQIYYGINNLPLADIINTIKGKEDWPEKKYPKPSANTDN